MGEFLNAAVGFPTMYFSAALVVVLGFWLLVLCGAVDRDCYDADVDTGALHLDGVPVSAAASVFIVAGSFLSVSGSILLDRAHLGGALSLLLSWAMFLIALFVAWWVTRGLVRPLAKLFPDEPGPFRQDFVGVTCTIIRTGQVDEDSGRAEVAARDGSTAVVQVRRHGHDPLARGSTALLCAYHETGEFFRVEPNDTAPGPRTPA